MFLGKIIIKQGQRSGLFIKPSSIGKQIYPYMIIYKLNLALAQKKLNLSISSNLEYQKLNAQSSSKNSTTTSTSWTKQPQILKLWLKQPTIQIQIFNPNETKRGKFEEAQPLICKTQLAIKNPINTNRDIMKGEMVVVIKIVALMQKSRILQQVGCSERVKN